MMLLVILQMIIMLNKYSISGMSPDDKPSAKQISELINLVKMKK